MLINLDYDTFEIPETDATIEVRPLNVVSYQKILKVMAGVGEIGDSVSAGLEQLSNPKILEIASEVLPNFTKNLKGIQIQQDGNIVDATVADLIKHGAFLQMCFQILLHLFTISGIKKEDEQKIKK